MSLVEPKQNISKNRNYGIDLLRIVAMIMIVHLHMLGHGGLLGAVEPASVQYAAAWLIEIICYGGVNIYALISGFVGYKSGLHYSRLLQIWLQVLFYSVVIFAIAFGLGVEKVTLKSLSRVILPVIRVHYWYISAYFGMIFLTPFVNVAIRNCEENLAKRFFIMVLIAYVTIPCILMHSDPASLKGGYSAFWLLLLFIIGAMVARFEWYKKFSSKRIMIFVIGMFGITWVTRLIIAYTTLRFLGKAKGAGLLVAYISPTLFLSSVGLLYAFSNIEFDASSKWIKFIKVVSPATLGVYLIHEHFVVRSHFVSGLTKNMCLDNPLLIIIQIIGLALSVYTVCTLIEIVRIRLFNILKVSKMCDCIVECCHKFWKW